MPSEKDLIKDQKKLAAAIQAGLDYSRRLAREGVAIEESPLHYIAPRFPFNNTWTVCIIGFALLGCFQDLNKAYQYSLSIWVKNGYTSTMCAFFAEFLGVSKELVRSIDRDQRFRKKGVDVIFPLLEAGSYVVFEN